MATHSTWASAIAAASATNTIKVLEGSWTENVTIAKQLCIEGSGYGSNLTGSITFDTSSDRFCFNGIPIYNNSTDCISYSPFLFRLSQKDINGDGFLDICFAGQVNQYCEGLEKGIGRIDILPKKRHKVKIVFLIDKQKQNFWYLKNDLICKELN